MKRLLTGFSALALLMTLILSVVPALPAHAAPGLSVEGAVLDVILSPGETYTHTITITGGADYTMEMQAEARGFGQSVDGSIIALSPTDDNSPYSARTFISNIDKTSFTLDPGSSQQIKATIDVPTGTTPGNKYAIVYVYSQPSGSGGVGIVVAANILVIVRVPGCDPLNNGFITDLEMSGEESGDLIQVYTTFKNTGNIHFKVKNRAAIKDETGQIISQNETALSSSSIIPGLSQLFTINLSYTEGTDGLPPGQYYIESVVVLEDGTLLDTKETGFVIFEDGTIEVEEPIADFTSNITSGDTPLTVTFSDESMGNITSWVWDFDNDGTVDSTDQNPTYTYNSIGFYSVTLTVTDTGGNSDTETKTGYIKVSKILVQQTVSSDSPATLKTAGEQVVIEFPQGLVVGDATVTIREEPQAGAPSCPSGFKAGETCFSIELTGELVSGTTVNITVKYSTADLEACGGDPDKLTLARYDEVAGKWVIMSTIVDSEAMTLTTSTDQFSIWMVMVDESNVEPLTPAESTEEIALWIWLVVAAGGLGILSGISSVIIMMRRRVA